MKLEEIKSSPIKEEFVTDRKEIIELLTLTGYGPDRVDNIEIDNGLVNLWLPTGKVLHCDSFIKNGELILNFDYVEGSCDFDYQFGWKSLKGFPKEVYGNFNCKSSKLTSYAGLPPKVFGWLNVGDNPIKSLVGIGEYFKHVKTLSLDVKKVEEGGIGLLQIPGLQNLHNNGRIIVHDDSNPFAIIIKYLGHPEKIFDCQTELIENGFEEFAQL